MDNEEVVFILQTLIMAVGNCRKEKEALERAIKIVESLDEDEDMTEAEKTLLWNYHKGVGDGMQKAAECVLKRIDEGATIEEIRGYVLRIREENDAHR